MNGQHVYVEEIPEGEREGLWLSDYFLAEDKNGTFVWKAQDGKLVRQAVATGEHDEMMEETEITDGLTEADSIAFPQDFLTEGMDAVQGTAEETLEPYYTSQVDTYDDGIDENGNFTGDESMDGEYTEEGGYEDGGEYADDGAYTEESYTDDGEYTGESEEAGL